MRTEVFQFEGKEISFLTPVVAQKDVATNVMVNATEMAKIFGKYPKDFLILDSTQVFIEEALKKENSPFLGIESEDDLVTSKQRTGTWMHRVLALKFAAWLSPKFELWVYRTIEELLFGKLVKRESSFERSFRLQKEASDLELKSGKTGEDFERYLEVQKQLRHEVLYRRSLTVAEANGMKSLFD
jgi:hypothetical protein